MDGFFGPEWDFWYIRFVASVSYESVGRNQSYSQLTKWVWERLFKQLHSARIFANTRTSNPSSSCAHSACFTTGSTNTRSLRLMFVFFLPKISFCQRLLLTLSCRSLFACTMALPSIVLSCAEQSWRVQGLCERVQGRRTRQHPRAKQSVSLVDLQSPNLEKRMMTMARRVGGAAVHENRR